MYAANIFAVLSALQYFLAKLQIRPLTCYLSSTIHYGCKATDLLLSNRPRANSFTVLKLTNQLFSWIIPFYAAPASLHA
jgi:hypothetical protein